jgi:cardiolipin synthase
MTTAVTSGPRPAHDDSSGVEAGARELADQAFSRSAGAPLIAGNHVRLLKDAGENYPVWLDAIAAARIRIHFENYIIADDEVGNSFADALIERARAGVVVRVIYDWLGVFRKASRGFWARLRAGGVEVRCYNPPRIESPLGWISRDHRKLLVVDGEVGFISGLCVARMWTGDPARDIPPWRDTGVEIRGPAILDMERAFARSWALLGEPVPETEIQAAADRARAGDISVRIVASEPATSGTFRLDQLVVAFARHRVWLTDAYYLGAPTYVQALVTSARDGVDVRMLFTRASDIPLLKVMSRVGYRALLEAGVRIFEWNGSLLHAKTAVVDSRWARVGSTNLNFASWSGNCELDAVIEDEGFAQQMEAMYLADLSNSTEVVLEGKRKLRKTQTGAISSPERKGRAGRAAAGAVRIGNVLGAALANRRVIEPIETRLLAWTGLGLLVLAVLFVVFPRVFAYPAGAILGWLALALLYRGYRLHRGRKRPGAASGR